METTERFLQNVGVLLFENAAQVTERKTWKKADGGLIEPQKQ